MDTPCPLPLRGRLPLQPYPCPPPLLQQQDNSLEGSRLGTRDAFASACLEKQTVMVEPLLLPGLRRLTAPRAWAQPGAGLMPPACWAVSL